MSVRVYTGPHADRHGSRRGVLGWLPWSLALAAVALQISYPLVTGDLRVAVTVASVLVFFLAATSHALVWRGPVWTLALLVVTVGGGLAVEAVGIRTGWPFGEYTYGDTLGATVLGVPWVVPLAWAMMAYPALVAARALSRSVVMTPLIGALALASWDLFLDPMMTAEGHWTFVDPAPTLPHVPGIPLLNYAGWFVTALVMMVLLDRLPRRTVPEGVPTLLFLWTYASAVMANLVFWDRPWVALYGGVAMGVVAVPFAWVQWSGRD